MSTRASHKKIRHNWGTFRTNLYVNVAKYDFTLGNELACEPCLLGENEIQSLDSRLEVSSYSNGVYAV